MGMNSGGKKWTKREILWLESVGQMPKGTAKLMFGRRS